MRAITRCIDVRLLRLPVLLLAATALAGCAAAPVRIEYETDGRLTTSTGEHLYRVRASEVGALYLKPGVRFADYGTVAFRPVTLAYKDDPPRTPATVTVHNKPGNFRLRPEAAERLKDHVSEALTGEFERDESVRVVPQPIGDTLMISSHIARLRWEVPPAQSGESLYVRRTGFMTLILDLRDAETGALLARLADARLIQPFDIGLIGAYENKPVNNWAGVRDVCRRWGSLLRGTLESLRELPPLPTP